MIGRGSEHNWGACSSYRQHRQVEGGLLNFTDWLIWEATDGPSSSHLPPDQRFDLESDILEQVNAYAKEDVDVLEEIDHYQSDESEQEEAHHPHQSFTDVCTSVKELEKKLDVQVKFAKEVKVSVESKLAKAKAENMVLQTHLRESQNDLQIVKRNYATLSGQVMSIEKKLKEAEEKLCTTLKVEAASREVDVMEAKQKAMVDFKESEEYKLATKDFDADYDKGVKQIFYNMRRKTCGVCYKFLGKEYRKHIAIWEDQEQVGILDTRPSLSLEYFDDECEILKDRELDNSNT